MVDGVPSWLPDAQPKFPAEDEFGVHGLIDRLVDEVASATPPFAVSVSGSWGVGKSTVARELVTRLRSRGVRGVLIDAWTVDVRHLRRHLVLEVGAALETGSAQDLPTSKQRKDVAATIDEAETQTTIQDAARVEVRKPRDIWAAISSSPISLLITSGVVALLIFLALQRGAGLDSFLLTIAGVLALGLLTTYVLRLTTPSRTRAPAASEVALAEHFRKTVTTPPKKRWLFGKREPTPIAVVVDNLDRLSGSDALNALSQIRALLDIEGSRCVFVIPIDRRRLADHLQQALRNGETADDFLEKFFGLDLALTQPEPVDLRRWAKTRAKRLIPDADDAELERMADVVVVAADRSPRVITRLINGAVTRYRVVAGLGRPLSLPQAALIEGVLLLAPNSLRALQRDPRAFTRAFGAVQAESDDARQMISDALGLPIRNPEVPPGEVVAVHRLLLSAVDLQLKWEDVRVALALRTNRLWKRVPDWDEFAEAMDVGDTERFDAALNGREDRGVVLESAVEALVDLGPRIPLSNGIRVLAPHLHPSVPRYQELQQVGIGYLGTSTRAFARMSEAEAAFLLDNGFAKHEPVVARLIDALNSEEPPRSSGLAAAAVYLIEFVDDNQLGQVRKALAAWSLDELRPLFETPNGVPLIEGPVAEAVAAPLSTWDPALTGPHTEHRDHADVLRRARDNGWSEPELLDRIAAQMTNGVPQMANNEPALVAGEGIIRLLEGAAPSNAIDGLAQVLAQPVGDRLFFSWALRLPMSDGGLSNVASRFDTWAKAEALDKVKPVLDEHRALLDTSSSNYRQLLLGRWQTKGHALAATLAVDGSADGPSALVAAWQSVGPDLALTRALQAMQVLDELGAKAAIEEIVGQLDQAVAKTSFALPGFGDLVTWMVSHTLSRQAIVAGLEAKAAALTTAPDLNSFTAAVVPTLSTLGKNQRAAIADVVAVKMIAMAEFDPLTTGHVAAAMSTSGSREELLVKMIDAGRNLDATLEGLGIARPIVGTSKLVREALVGRAQREGNATNARRDLEEASLWKQAKTKLSASAEADLESVYTQHPELQELKLAP